MDFIENIKKLKEKENRVYLLLLVWLLIAYAAMEILTLEIINLPLIAIAIYFPLLGFTSFLWFISLFKKRIKDYSFKTIIFLLVIDFFLMIIFAVVIIVILVASIFSYVIFTSFFSLYGCYKAGKETDEKLYYKTGAWFWRRLEFWGGLVFSLLLLTVFLFGTFELTNILEAPQIIVVAYIAVMLAILFLAGYGLVYNFVRKFNAWLGTYFLLVTFYTIFLVMKVFLGLTSGTGSSSSIPTIILLLFLDLFILIYSISCILGSQSEILDEKFKRYKKETLLLWLLFSKAAYEYARNFPYGTLGIAQAIGITNVSVIGSLIHTIANIIILTLFIIMVIIFGIKGIMTYSQEQETLKSAREKILLAKNTGEREKLESEGELISVPKDFELEKPLDYTTENVSQITEDQINPRERTSPPNLENSEIKTTETDKETKNVDKDNNFA
ncbi:MAG: hypothetical protein GF383_09890 [Candidatus Lokiarchaeota archaeon]|nr:hypothetical protein [Candidatus Lokiarchaeota archaeon]MBD3340842.1 hypothetical protein [Candidatus Lokiarchaeota archaeon]